MTLRSVDGDSLRELVRDVLRDVLPTAVADARRENPTPVASPEVMVTAPPQDAPDLLAPGIAGAAADGDVVVLRNDADLDAFVRRLLTMFENPKHRSDLRAGRRRFRLGGVAGGTGGGQAVHRVDRGAVTESAVRHAAAAGARLVLGPRAVLTPLAHDRARALGVVVEKER